ncbi:hypothetical protein QF117_10580 [Vibrio sp. YMD68]|uniref:hypothetical protein n=1 Tax=Vibrio sp. YMD68 TaxID=3042300 RepID=UPI002499E95B|nr:hypothetical protein [Vibrio sp. YMD68]WGV98838.1 hypothetical protein QF117_02430 [Vibrio sp. YMD68]WGW01235.1 hypothetical protein QF117_10580 [Vibrio sp. YMD68]
MMHTNDTSELFLANEMPSSYIDSVLTEYGLLVQKRHQLTQLILDCIPSKFSASYEVVKRDVLAGKYGKDTKLMALSIGRKGQFPSLSSIHRWKENNEYEKAALLLVSGHAQKVYEIRGVDFAEFCCPSCQVQLKAYRNSHDVDIESNESCRSCGETIGLLAKKNHGQIVVRDLQHRSKAFPKTFSFMQRMCMVK